ncbi:MAG: NrdH-redoxin [Candidatus Paceibacterota bacterium]|jgi:glutaredoxin
MKRRTRKKVIVYGAFWCPDTHATAKRLQRWDVSYVARPIENLRTAADLKKLLAAEEFRIPVVIFPDGTRLIEPDAKTLRDKVKLLKKQGLL